MCISIGLTRRFGASALALFGVLVIAAVVAFAAQEGKGSISGVVMKADKSGLAGAVVNLTNLKDGESQEAVTGESGVFEFNNLESGTYELAVDCEGYESFLSDEIDVTDGAIKREVVMAKEEM